MSSTLEACTEVTPGAAQILFAHELNAAPPAAEGPATCLALPLARKNHLVIKAGLGPRSQPPAPSSALNCFCGLGVAAQWSSLLVLLPDLFSPGELC